jgi:outer membrane murein-binding lipoprotein Lpp
MTENKPFTFYANNIQVKSFFDEKAKKQRYMVGGYISTGDLDLVNDIATEDCRRDLSAQFKGRKIKLDYDHETIRADRNQDEFDSRLNLTKPVLGKAVSEENDGVGNMVWFELNPNWKKFDLQGNVTMDFKSVWEDIENGYYDAFSIAYVPTKTRMMAKGGSQIRLLDKVNLINVALTGNPVNPAARMMDFRTVMAKSLEYMKEKEDGNMQDTDVKSRLDKIEEEINSMKEQKSHSQEPNGGIMMESEKKSEANAEAQPEQETQTEPQAKANKDYEDKPADDSEDEEDKKEGKSLEIDAKSFAEMKSEVADLKSKVEELEKQNKDMKSILEEARPAAKGPEDEQQKQAKSQPNGVPFKGPLDLI